MISHLGELCPKAKGGQATSPRSLSFQWLQAGGYPSLGEECSPYSSAFAAEEANSEARASEAGADAPCHWAPGPGSLAPSSLPLPAQAILQALVSSELSLLCHQWVLSSQETMSPQREGDPPFSEPWPPSSGLSRAPCSLQEPRPGAWVWELGERTLISLCMQVEGQAGPAGEGFSAARSQLSLEGPASRQQQGECGLCWLPGLDGQAATVRSRGPVEDTWPRGWGAWTALGSPTPLVTPNS